MKKIIFILSAILIVSSCTKLEDLNENIKDPSEVSGESLFTGAQITLFDQMVTPNVNFNNFRMFVQHWTETTYLDEANYDLETRTVPDNHWDELYRDVLMDLKQSAINIGETEYPTDPNPAIKVNRLAVVDIMAVYAWSVLVETFGNVPYTDALDSDIPLPTYDDGLTIYKDLIARLNADMAAMNDSWGSFDNADNMYGGDVASWIKFANSLKLRMGIMLADVDAAFAQTTVEAATADLSKLIQSNAENAKIIYAASQPNANPVYDNLVASGRKDFVAANTLVDAMNALNDPRRPLYFTLSEDSLGNPAYVGGVYGYSSAYSQYSHVADALQLPTFEGTIFDYAEVEFLLAEAIERGFTVSGTAQGHYDDAITASILYWGGTSAEATTYLADPLVDYTTATGDYKQKIGEQQWIAYYNRGFEAWNSWRRLDYPALIASDNPDFLISDIPLRYTYPIAEQTLNGANYYSASAAIGGDDVATKLFFDMY